MAILPPYLKAGDSIALIATARKISHLELLPSIQLIESWGLNVITAPNLYKEEINGGKRKKTCKNRKGKKCRKTNKKQKKKSLAKRKNKGRKTRRKN